MHELLRRHALLLRELRDSLRRALLLACRKNDALTRLNRRVGALDRRVRLQQLLLGEALLRGDLRKRLLLRLLLLEELLLRRRLCDHVDGLRGVHLIGRGAVLRIGLHEFQRGHAVLRGHLNYIEVGSYSNIQDGSVIHLGDNDPTVIGEYVVVGHRAGLHGCTLEDHVLIGMQATVLDGAVIGRGSIIGAGAIVPSGSVIPPLSLVLGMPGKVVKSLSPEKEATHRKLAEKYARLAANYRNA